MSKGAPAGRFAGSSGVACSSIRPDASRGAVEEVVKLVVVVGAGMAWRAGWGGRPREGAARLVCCTLTWRTAMEWPGGG
eukprot:1310311-Prymnesium_polylepis.1